MFFIRRATAGRNYHRAEEDFEHGAGDDDATAVEELTPALWLELDESEPEANRLKTCRLALREGLERLETPGDWRHITEQNGMFSYVGLSVEQVTLRNKYHVYLQDTGRISIAGFNNFNLNHTIHSISAVVETTGLD